MTRGALDVPACQADPLINYDATRSAVELGALTGMRLGALHLSGQRAAVASRFARWRRYPDEGCLLPASPRHRCMIMVPPLAAIRRNR